jgi:hypothetical protein
MTEPLTLHELLDLLHKIEATDNVSVDRLKVTGENEYTLSIYSDWRDGGRFYIKEFTVCSSSGATSPDFDDIKWDVEVMYKETMEEKELQNKRQAVLDKLTVEVITDEEKELLGL